MPSPGHDFRHAGKEKSNSALAAEDMFLELPQRFIEEAASC